MISLTAVIPVRDNNEGKLIHKDYLPFAGTNLLINKIKQLKKIRGIEIVVTTDCKLLSDMAKDYDVEVMDRPSKYALENQLFGDFIEYTCKNLKTEHILWACVTSPLIDEKIYSEAINVYVEKLLDGYDSLISVQRLQRYLMDKNGALNFRKGNKMKTVDQLPELYIFTNGISIAPRKSMIDWKYTSGDMPYLLELGKRESIDICDEFDYASALKFCGEKSNE
jgi:N-acylneuraminate cytidylyltransferase